MSLNKSQLHQDKVKTESQSYQKKNPNVQSLEIELDDDAVAYYRSQGYLVEYVDGGSILSNDPPKKDDQEPEYMYLDLDDDAAKQYKDGGWVVEEYPDGGDVDFTEHGWEYKKEGDKYLTRRENDTNWITASGVAKSAIQSDVYNEQVNIPGGQQTYERGDGKQAAPRESYVQQIQKNLASQKYYLGPKGVDGVLGDFTQDAIDAQEAGISADDYNKRFKAQPLKTLPGVTVPPGIVENAQGIKTPVSNSVSAAAQESMQEMDLGDSDDSDDSGYSWYRDEYRPTTDTETTGDREATSDVPKTLKKSTPYVYNVEEKGWRSTVDNYDYSHGDFGILDITDKVYQHADDFIMNPDEEWGLKTEFAAINNKAKACLKGALNCNQDFVSDKVGASSIRGLIGQMRTELASSTRYSIKSKSRSQPLSALEHSKGYDAWEIADALIGEGLAQDMFYIDPGSEEFSRVQKQNIPAKLDALIQAGKIPLGALVMQGNSNLRGYTDPKMGNRSSHGTTVVGFDKKGIPLIYDNGTLVSIYDPMFDVGINRIVVPKGYEGYTYNNLMKGQSDRLKKLGYKDGVKEEAKFVKEEGDKPYVSQIKKGTNKHKIKIGSDYNIKSDVMDKLSYRVIGLAAQETNFGDQGDESLDWRRSAVIAAEGNWTNSIAKPIAKWAEAKWDGKVKGKADWEIEIMTAEYLGLTEGYNHNNPLHREAFAESYADLRAQYPKSSGQNSDYGNSSVGPLAIKNLSSYSRNELGLNKDDMYGMTVSDDWELEAGGEAALVHLVEDFRNLRDMYSRDKYSDDQIIDLATIAYNNRSKAYSKEFAHYFIEDARSGREDSYLEKVKIYESKYMGTKARTERTRKYAAINNKKEEAIRKERTKNWTKEDFAEEAKRKTENYNNIKIDKSLINNMVVQPYQSESTSVNMPSFQTSEPLYTVEELNAFSQKKLLEDEKNSHTAPVNNHYRNYGLVNGGESNSAMDYLKRYVLGNK